MSRHHNPTRSALAIALAAILAPCIATATQPTANGTASTVANVQSRGAMAIGSNGGSLSYAASSQSATARIATSSPAVAATLRACPPAGMSGAVSGSTTTTSSGVAYNVSNGAAGGGAVSSGSVGASVQGKAGVGQNVAGGMSGTMSDFKIVAGRDQGSAVQGSTGSGFDASVTVQRGSIGGQPGRGVGIDTATSGYVTGSNATATLAGMNAAGIARIDATGAFKSYGGAVASTAATPQAAVTVPHGAPK